MNLEQTPALVTTALALLGYASVPGLERLPGGDSGELLAEACVGGVAHPPGYPLLLGLLRLAFLTNSGRFPFVLVANALNAVLAAAAAGLISHCVHLLTEKQHPSAAITAGLLFAFSSVVWEHARGVEVRSGGALAALTTVLITAI